MKRGRSIGPLDDQTKEEYNRTVIERNYLTRSRKNIYLAGEDLDLTWDESEVKETVKMWKHGIPLIWMARNFDRKDEEVGILIIDLGYNGRIQPRKNGLWGRG